MNLNLNPPSPKREIVIAGIFVVAAFLLYARSLFVDFLSDDYYALFLFHEQGLRCFYDLHDRTFIPFTLFVLGVVDVLSGSSVVAFRIVSIVIHALNAFMVYRFTIAILKNSSINSTYVFFPAVLSGLLFLAMPFQAEAVVWMAASAYPLGTALCLATLLTYMKYRSDGRFPMLLLSGILFFFALLSKEFAVVIPLLLIVAEVVFYIPKSANKRAFRNTVLRILFFLCILFLFMVLRRIALGEWVGLYGSEVHLQFSIYGLFNALIRYALHFMLLFRYWYDHFGVLSFWLQLVIVVFVFAVMLFLTARSVFRFRHKVKSFDNGPFKGSHFLFFLMLAFIALVPVINLETTFISQIQSERYGYFASAFVSPAIVLLIGIFIRSDKIRIVFSILLLCAYIVFLQTDITKFRDAGFLARKVLHNAKVVAASGEQIVLLNVPDTYNGVYVFRNGLKEALSVGLPDLSNEVFPLSYFSSEGDSTRIACEITNDTLLISSVSPGISIFPDREALPCSCARLLYAGGNRVLYLIESEVRCRYFFYETEGDLKEICR